MIPGPRVTTVNNNAFVYASHASNRATIIPYTGFILFGNRASMVWFRKQHNIV